MEITLEAVEKVMDQTGVEFKVAKEALQKTDGDVDAAIKLIQPDMKDIGEDTKAIIDRLKKKVEEGNVDRIQIKKDDEVVFSVPVNVGVVGGILGFAAAPCSSSSIDSNSICAISAVPSSFPTLRLFTIPPFLFMPQHGHFPILL